MAERPRDWIVRITVDEAPWRWGSTFHGTFSQAIGFAVEQVDGQFIDAQVLSLTIMPDRSQRFVATMAEDK